MRLFNFPETGCFAQTNTIGLSEPEARCYLAIRSKPNGTVAD
jgi:hypothetical protein